MASIWEKLFSDQDYRTAAPAGGYADLYANGLLGNRTDTPASVEAMQTGKDFIPGIGDAIALKEAYDAASRGDKVAAGLLATGAALGLIPGAGDAVARPVMAAGRKAADVASRIEVDPNAVGSLLGNVRMKPTGSLDMSELRDTPNEMRSNQVLVRIPIKDVEHGESAMPGGKLTWPDAPKLIEEYAQKGTDLPPIDIMSDEGGMAMIADGSHRFEAAKLRGQDYVEAYVNSDDLAELPSAEIVASTPAEEIAGLLSSGRADDVTDEMLGNLTAQDNSELFDLYQSGATGMDLPMDEASRLARADKMFPRKGFHGTNANIDGFQGNVFSSDNPTLASTYAKGSVDAQIYPLRLGSKVGDTVVEGGGADWSRLNISDVKDPSVAEWLDWAEGQKISTREIERAAIREGRSGVQFKDIKDTGPGFNSSQFKNLGYTKEQERALQKQYMEDLSKPSNVDVRLSPNLVRSRFARFDPRLANLKNLSAGVGAAPIGLLALREEQKRANEEQYKRGLLQ